MKMFIILFQRKLISSNEKICKALQLRFAWYGLWINTPCFYVLAKPTIIFIIFWDILIFYQIFLSQQVKRSANISNKHGIDELPYELLNDLRLRKLGKVRKISNLHTVIPQCPVTPHKNKKIADTSKKLLKIRN